MRLYTLLLVLLSMISCGSQKETTEASASTHTDTLPSRPASIVSIYTVEELMMPDGSMRNVTDLKLTLELQSQNTIMGFSGCNQFHGEYSYSAGVFSTSKMASTKKMCAEDMDVENALLRYLQTSLDVETIDRGLMLSKADAQVMKLRKIDE